MDVHRCRFVDHPSSAINALAFSHQSSLNAGAEKTLKLAIGRANGNIEIWNPLRGSWCHEVTFYGGRDRSVEGLAWTCDPAETGDDGKVVPGRLRLFSIGYSSTVTEWDLMTGIPLRQSSGSHSEVWCLAAQPPVRKNRQSKLVDENGAGVSKSPSQDIAVGCADGGVVLLSTLEDSLHFKRYIARTSQRKARALSISWRDRSTLAVGFADTSIRVYDVTKNSLIRGISLGGGPREGPKEKLVWAINFLKDGTLVSGDSGGEVCFWDKVNYGQLQRIKSHEADVLCLTVGADGRSVFSSGIDRRTCSYSKGRDSRWSKTGNGRIHKHDVKAMTSFESKTVSVIVSGGLDTQPIIAPLREFGKEHHRRLPHLPQSSPVTGAQRLLVSWWENQVSVWTVHSRSKALINDIDNETDDAANNYKLLSRVTLKSEEHITSASVTSEGDMIAVATIAEVKVFHLQHRGPQNERLRIKKLELQRSVRGGARMIQFSPDSRWLLSVNYMNEVHADRIAGSNSGQKPTLSLRSQHLRRLERSTPSRNSLNNTWGSYDRTITKTAISDDSRIIAVADLAGYIDTWLLSDEEGKSPSANGTAIANGASETSSNSEDDSDEDASAEPDAAMNDRKLEQRWRRNPMASSLPRLPGPPLLLSFRPRPRSTTAPSGDEAPPGPSTIGTHASHSKEELFRPDTLLTLTSSHSLTLHNIHTSTQTPWSLRNPSAILPAKFKIQLDRAIGCVWDVQTAPPSARRSISTGAPRPSRIQPDQRKALQRQDKRQRQPTKPQQNADPNPDRCRVWLYGANWLCMFDLLQDLPIPPTLTPSRKPAHLPRATADEGANPDPNLDPATALTLHNSRTLKRKRSKDARYHLALDEGKRTSGAGGKRRVDELGSGLRISDANRTPIARSAGSGAVSVSDRQVAQANGNGRVSAAPDDDDDDNDDDDIDDEKGISPSSDGDDESDDDEHTAIALAITRRNEAALAEKDTNPISISITADADADAKTTHLTASARNHPPPAPFHLTNEYRCILGVVALSSRNSPPSRFEGEGEGEGEGEDSTGDGAKPEEAEEGGGFPQALEVALIERNVWDLDLGPRFEKTFKGEGRGMGR